MLSVYPLVYQNVVVVLKIKHIQIFTFSKFTIKSIKNTYSILLLKIHVHVFLKIPIPNDRKCKIIIYSICKNILLKTY